MSEPFKVTDAFITGVIDLLIWIFFSLFSLPRLGVSGFHPNTPTRLGRIRQWRGDVSGAGEIFFFFFFFFFIFFSIFY